MDLKIKNITHTEAFVSSSLKTRDLQEQAHSFSFISEYQKLLTKMNAKNEQIKKLTQNLANGIQANFSLANRDKIVELQEELQQLYKKMADKNDYCIRLREELEAYKKLEKDLNAKLASVTDSFSDEKK